MIGKAQEIIMKLFDLAKQGDEQIYELRLYRAPRTLSQNAYYWQLLTKVASKLRMKKPELHNRMLRDYGKPMYVADQLVLVYLPDTEEAERTALGSEKHHLKPTSQVKKDRDGVMRRTYVMLRGSSDYNTAEMSALVDGIVQEAKAQGIETMTPAELAQLRRDEQAAEDRKKRRRSA